MWPWQKPLVVPLLDSPMPHIWEAAWLEEILFTGDPMSGKMIVDQACRVKSENKSQLTDTGTSGMVRNGAKSKRRMGAGPIGRNSRKCLDS